MKAFVLAKATTPVCTDRELSIHGKIRTETEITHPVLGFWDKYTVHTPVPCHLTGIFCDY